MKTQRSGLLHLQTVFFTSGKLLFYIYCSSWVRLGLTSLSSKSSEKLPNEWGKALCTYMIWCSVCISQEWAKHSGFQTYTLMTLRLYMWTDRVSDSPIVITSCDSEYIALHGPTVGDSADSTALTLLVLCSAAHQPYKGGLVLMQQKAIENIKHICRRNTPTGGRRQILLFVRVRLCMCLCTSANVAHVYVWLSTHSAGASVPVWASQRGKLCPLGNQLVRASISSGTG